MDKEIFIKKYSHSLSMVRAIEAGDKKYIVTCETYDKLKTGQIDKNQAIRIMGDIGINRNVVDLWLQDLKVNQFELTGWKMKVKVCVNVQLVVEVEDGVSLHDAEQIALHNIDSIQTSISSDLNSKFIDLDIEDYSVEDSWEE